MTAPRRDGDAAQPAAASLKRILVLPDRTHSVLMLTLALLTVVVGVSTRTRSAKSTHREAPRQIDEATGDGEKIDINTASWIRLSELPGIGKARSKAIVRWRAEHGPFRSIDDVFNVPGIPRKLAETLKERATVGRPEEEPAEVSD